MLHDNESADVITRSVGVVVITSALHAVGHGFETHTEYFCERDLNSVSIIGPLNSCFDGLNY